MPQKPVESCYERLTQTPACIHEPPATHLEQRWTWSPNSVINPVLFTVCHQPGQLYRLFHTNMVHRWQHAAECRLSGSSGCTAPKTLHTQKPLPKRFYLHCNRNEFVITATAENAAAADKCFTSQILPAMMCGLKSRLSTDICSWLKSDEPKHNQTKQNKISTHYSTSGFVPIVRGMIQESSFESSQLFSRLEKKVMVTNLHRDIQVAPGVDVFLTFSCRNRRTLNNKESLSNSHKFSHNCSGLLYSCHSTK